MLETTANGKSFKKLVHTVPSPFFFLCYVQVTEAFVRQMLCARVSP